MWGELSWGEFSLGRVVLGRVVFGASCPDPIWTFRDMDFSWVVLSRHIGPFATRYFSHHLDPSRFLGAVYTGISRLEKILQYIY